MTPNPQTPAEPAAPALPRHSASDGPVTRAYRVAFQIWMLCVLLTLVMTLAFYLFDKIYLLVTRR
jgi:hypothetical protein